MSLLRYIESLQDGEDLSPEEMKSAFGVLLSGSASDEDIARFLLSLKENGIMAHDIAAAASVMREHMRPFAAPEGAMDVCGTGGDAKGTYNISTTVAIVTAACGVPVVKHGNKAVSSQSGSTDVLDALGVVISDDEANLQRCVQRANICYLAAPFFHPAMKHVAAARRQIQSRTIFNLLGPLCNPGRVKHQLLGVYAQRWVEPMALVLQSLGSTSAMVVHGLDGLDELTVTEGSHIARLQNDSVECSDITPAIAGLRSAKMQALVGGDATHNAHALVRLLEGEDTAYRDAVLFNTAAALMVAQRADDWKAGVALAKEAIDSGRARKN